MYNVFLNNVIPYTILIDNNNDNDNDNDNDIFIILTVIYIAMLHSIISLKLSPSPEELISQSKTGSEYNLCFCEVHS